MSRRRSPAGGRRVSRPSRSLLLGFALATFITVTAGPPTGAGAEQAQDPAPVTSAPDRGEDDNEHGAVDPYGIEMTWALPVRNQATRLDVPLLGLTVRNLDAAIYDVEVRTLEDAGSLQSRRTSEPIRATLFVQDSLSLEIPFGAELPPHLTHSGMFVAVLTACPRDGGRCITGTSQPLFFHPDGGYLVYSEDVLCKRYNCGALTERVQQEKGTWRIMGGRPLLEASSREEPDQDDDQVVDGGDL